MDSLIFHYRSLSKRVTLTIKFLALITFTLTANLIKSCTIFLLTDAEQTLFFNNEDYTNPNTKMWFIPGGNEHYGCVFLGFDNGHAQGGMNTEGLAFDWWAGGYSPYEVDRTKPLAKSSSSERMLESCKTVDEAIAFYKKHAEPSFANATIFIADKTGASVIIGSKDGKLFFKRSTESQVLGAGAATFQKMIAENNKVQQENGVQILKQCLTTGTFATKYSNVFDLQSGAISLYRLELNSTETRLNLFEELKKGAHYYNIPSINKELKEEIKPLILNMKRLILFDFPVVEAPATINKVEPNRIFSDLSNGTIDTADYKQNYWESFEIVKAEIKAELEPFGSVEKIKLTHKVQEKELLFLYFITIYSKGRILWKLSLGPDALIHDIEFRSATFTKI